MSPAAARHGMIPLGRTTSGIPAVGIRPRLCEPARRAAARSLADGIEVDAYRDHAGQKVKGRFDVDHAGLDAPWPEPVYIYALPHRNRAVLVPNQRPVLLRALVKENCAYGKTFPTE